MFLVVSWIFSGAILGSVGVALVASAMSNGTRTDDFQTPLLMLMATTVVGAVSGGVLASKVRKSVQDQRRINQLAAIPPFLAVLLVIIVIRLT